MSYVDLKLRFVCTDESTVVWSYGCLSWPGVRGGDAHLVASGRYDRGEAERLAAGNFVSLSGDGTVVVKGGSWDGHSVDASIRVDVRGRVAEIEDKAVWEGVAELQLFHDEGDESWLSACRLTYVQAFVLASVRADAGALLRKLRLPDLFWGGEVEVKSSGRAFHPTTGRLR